MITAFRVAYYVIVIVAAAAGLVNTLQLRGHHLKLDQQERRLNLIERVRERLRNHLVGADDSDAAAMPPDVLHSHLLDRIEALERRVREPKELEQ